MQQSFYQTKYNIQKLGSNQDKLESFISNLVNSLEPEKMIDVANQVVRLSASESIPLEDLGKRKKKNKYGRYQPNVRLSTSYTSVH
jgi:hypothetical protein